MKFPMAMEIYKKKSHERIKEKFVWEFIYGHSLSLLFAICKKIKNIEFSKVQKILDLNFN